jgi:predicted lysophospholipase L1 biosynthesis ABC-type transport system permease subunit
MASSDTPKLAYGLLRRTWNGTLPLWQTFWLGLVLWSLALGGLMRFVVADAFFWISVRGALLLYFVVASAVLGFFWVAVWRSASRSQRIPAIAARVVVALHAGWYLSKFGRFLAAYGTLA